ncbi:MAG: HAD family hydrolase, partial [Rhodospirillales bacterium]|nr:HAD family hydrolase [Rhodospirillales bacterium]
RAILFDWDNTLVETWNCIHVAMNVTLRHMGHAEWEIEETCRRVALSLRDAFPVMFGERWQEAREVFYDAFRAIHLEELRPCPGAAEMLEQLAGLGVWLGVVSNKNGEFLRREAEHLGWNRYFRRLIGATDAERDKPDAAPVWMALDGSGVTPGAEVWFVGDALVDMQCALNAGCIPLLVRPEKPGHNEFSSHPPSRHFAGCDDLAALVRDLSVPISRI